TVEVPGKIRESELIKRITSKDEEEVMPPPKSNRKLTRQQIELLEQWVDSGAKWGKHWAYEPSQRPPIPTLRDPGVAVRNPIDNFILARLEQQGLTPSPQVPRET